MVLPCLLFWFGGCFRIHWGCVSQLFSRTWRPMNYLFLFLLFLKWNLRFLHNTLEQEAGEGVKKNIKYCGTKIARVGNADVFFCFSFRFPEKKKTAPILLSPSRVNRGKRCFRAGRNCEEIGSQAPFILDCLKIVPRAAFWGQLSCSEEGAQRCVWGEAAWGSRAGTGLRLQSPPVALGSQQCQLLKEGKERLGTQRKGSMKPFLPTGATSLSATGEVLVGQNESWQA